MFKININAECLTDVIRVIGNLLKELVTTQYPLAYLS
jgi:hypothetical protein